jgi:GTP-binding protein HflX
VGYTNAGKSSLFNCLTGAGGYVANQLFATLDPTLRNCPLPNNSDSVLADTVGFIRHLPHELVAAFKSTLQETATADLLLHVIDAHSEDRDIYINEVNRVLAEIDADKINCLQIFNKIDLLPGCQPHVDRDEQGNAVRVWLSAESGQGVNLLLNVLAEQFANSKNKKKCYLRSDQGHIRAKLFTCAKIIDEHIDDTGGSNLIIEIDNKYLGLLSTIHSEEYA